MKKIKISFLLTLVTCICGCMNKDNMENITIYTTSYPIEYVVNRLYGENSTVKSIYPNGIDINTYKITDTLLKKYDDADLYIFNGLSTEKDYLNPLLKVNSNLKIIDSTSSLKYENSADELWLDPSKLLTIANNIKKGFNEYITSNYLKTPIEENYQSLKMDLTNLDAKYRSDIKNSEIDTIIVSDDIFLFLTKYDLNVISLDSDTVTQKNITDATELIKSGNVDYIFIKEKEEVSKTVTSVIGKSDVKTLELHTLGNLTDEEKSKYDYLSLSSENLETLKEELYKD